MGADILIHRCTLHISRRGGWSWGADPRGLLRAALKRLPDLIAERLGESWPAQDERQVAAPLRLRISLRLDELLALSGDASGSEATAAALEGGLAQRIGRAVQELVLSEAGTAAVDQPAIAPENDAAAAGGPDVQAVWAGSVLSVLLGWDRQGALQTQLLSFSPASLASWHDSLLQMPGRPGPPPNALARAGVSDLAAEFAGMPLPLPAGRVASLIRRISLMVSAAHHFALSPGDPILEEALRAHRTFDMPMANAPNLERADETHLYAQPTEAPQDEPPEVPQAPAAACAARVLLAGLKKRVILMVGRVLITRI